VSSFSHAGRAKAVLSRLLCIVLVLGSVSWAGASMQSAGPEDARIKSSACVVGSGPVVMRNAHNGRSAAAPHRSSNAAVPTLWSLQFATDTSALADELALQLLPVQDASGIRPRAPPRVTSI